VNRVRRNYTVSIAAFAVSAGSGCSSWPLHSNLDPVDVELVDANVDPRTLFDLSWQFAGEVEPNEQPGPPVGTAYVGSARLIEGQLSGIGWANGAQPVVLEGSGCGSEGTRSPVADSGDYIGDVDVINISILEAGELCARLLIDEESVSDERGWDLLLFPLDPCDVPEPPVLEAAPPDGEPPAPIGFSHGGGEIDWSHTVRTGEAFSVLVAGFTPNQLDAIVPYQLGLSVISSPPDGREVLCPLLPSEVSP